MASESNVIQRLLGVYDADGTWRGELTYWIAARFGRTHCALCDITHGLFRTRPDWTAARATLPAPFEAYHRDDQPEALRHVAGGIAPIVAAETGSGLVVLLHPADLDGCAGSIEDFLDALRSAAERRGLTWAGPADSS